MKPTMFHGRCAVIELALLAYRPVISAKRLGVQSGAVVKARSKTRPSRASASRFGDSLELAPYAPSMLRGMSSARKIAMLGCCGRMVLRPGPAELYTLEIWPARRVGQDQEAPRRNEL